MWGSKEKKKDKKALHAFCGKTKRYILIQLMTKKAKKLYQKGSGVKNFIYNCRVDFLTKCGVLLKLMDITSENLLVQFLRSQCNVFMVEDVLHGLASVGLKEKKSDVVAFLNACPLTFPLNGNIYISKAGVFTNALFSIKPSKMELQQGFLLPGHRCIPFVDSEIPSGMIDFVYNDKILPHKVVNFSLNDALSFFGLFGEEYAFQYIMSDPAVDSMNPAKTEDDSFTRVSLTVTDFSEVYKETDFQLGDTFLASVVDWDKSIVAVQPLHIEKSSPFEQLPLDKKRLEWYSSLEDSLLESFASFGPGTSIDDQLSKVFFAFRSKLCVPYCGTIEQFIRQSKKIGIESYGVETRLWFKGQDVPAIGAWMNSQKPESDFLYGIVAGSPQEFPLLQSVLDSWIMDQFYRKKDKDELVLEDLFPEGCILRENETKRLKKEIAARKEAIGKTYNWFADFEVAEIRYSILKLYKRISSLVYEIDSAYTGLESFPQQPLVILTQLLNHSRFMLEVLLNEEEIKSEDKANFTASVEGMEYNFEEVYGELKSAMEEYQKKTFRLSRTSR